MMKAVVTLFLCTFSCVSTVNIYVRGPVNIIDCRNPTEDSHITEKPVECPTDQGFFNVEGQCFKYFKEEPKSWYDARDDCLKHGLVLAKPNNPVALRKYILDNFHRDSFGEGSLSFTYVGGYSSGDGRVTWTGTGSGDGSEETLSVDSPYWAPKHPGRLTSTKCLKIMTTESSMKKTPDQPYWMDTCTQAWAKYVCQVV